MAGRVVNDKQCSVGYPHLVTTAVEKTVLGDGGNNAEGFPVQRSVTHVLPNEQLGDLILIVVLIDRFGLLDCFSKADRGVPGASCFAHLRLLLA